MPVALAIFFAPFTLLGIAGVGFWFWMVLTDKD